MNFRNIALGCAALAWVGAASAAPAAYCGAAGTVTNNGFTISVEDFTYRGDDATDCYGVASGNDSADALNSASVFGFSDWTQLVRWNAGNSAPATQSGTSLVDFGDLTFSLNYLGLVGAFHEYSLTANPEDVLPVTLDLVGVIKQGNYYSAYEFSPASVLAGANLGTFKTTFGPGVNDFSHFTFYGRNYSEDGNGGGDDDFDVSAPGTLALVGLGLFAVGALRRRRST